MPLDDCLVQPLAHNLAANRNLASIHVDVLLLQCLRDILARHRAEEPPVLADTHGNLHLDLLELRCHEFCLIDRHGILARLRARLRLCDIHILAARRQCELLRQEEIAPVAVRNLHNLALFPDILNVRLQYDLHDCHSPLYMPLPVRRHCRAPR